MLKYDLKDFNNIIFEGFNINLPDELISMISNLSVQVGSPTYIKTPTFKKKDTEFISETNTNKYTSLKKKFVNVNCDDWESIKSYKSTKIELKEGLDGKIDLIRSYLNKISEKSYEEQCNNIYIILDELIKDNTSEEDMIKIGNSIFEIASNNRFYSKLYADLYTKLISEFALMKIIFVNNLNKYLDVFDNIEYVSAEENYDMFCRINRENERRKSLSSFFINLSINQIISRDKIIELTFNLLKKVVSLVNEQNKKSVVDEIVENISILYKKEWFTNCDTQIDGLTFVQTVEKFANSNPKTYNSLTNKSIFKFMDILEL
jgi:hypothetical protein